MPEDRDCPQTVIIPPGKPRLLHLDSVAKEIVIQTPTVNLVRVQRHYNGTISRTELCTCNPLCESSREDTFASVLEWVGPLTWEQKIWSIPEGALALLFRVAILKQQSKELGGLRIMARRNGASDNSRVVLDYLGKVKTRSNGFDVATAVLKITGIATDFFRKVETEPDVPNADQIVTPIRARIGQMPRGGSSSSSGKPRLPLGKPQKK